MSISDNRSHVDAIRDLNEITRLQAQVAMLQARGTELVMERQAANRFGARMRRQSIVLAFVKRLFGDESASPRERALRVVEEAIEFAQAVGVERDRIERCVDYTFGRPAGSPVAELGGVLVTVLGAAAALGVNAEEVERDELERMFSLDEAAFRLKHEQKRAAGITAR